MATIERPIRCVLLAPTSGDFSRVRRVIESAAESNKVELISPDEDTAGTAIAEAVFGEASKADLVIADASHSGPNGYYEIGLAQATGKPVIIIIDEEVGTPLFGVPFTQFLTYSRSGRGLDRFHSNVRRLFADFKRDAHRFLAFPQITTRPAGVPVIDLDRLEPRESENLCFELLTHMGFRRLEWGKQLREIDVVATLPKKDPDGFEYNELWLISMGLHAPSRMVLEMAMEPEYFWDRILRQGLMEHFSSSFRTDMPITLLLILLRDDVSSEELRQEARRMELRLAQRRSRYTLRIRLWDKQQLANLIQQYPQIAYKYFSEDSRAQSTSRKSYEQLYLENASLSQANQVTIAALKEERDKRVRAERDAVWKDVAFTAAHKLGNPIFALETNLQGIRRKISTNPQEASKVAKEMGDSIERAKIIIEQFKSLTKAQEIAARPVDLVPLIKGASRVATGNGVAVEIAAGKKQPLAFADPARMTECFDELFANALHWLRKPEHQINVTVDVPTKNQLPADLNGAKQYIRVRFSDNGCGIPADKKEKIFAPFYTTYPHGTGLGLSLVQRVIEGQGGLIREVGKPDEGALFEIFLPQATAKQ
jgi:signal transduction histidine kinase